VYLLGIDRVKSPTGFLQGLQAAEDIVSYVVKRIVGHYHTVNHLKTHKANLSSRSVNVLQIRATKICRIRKPSL
jgi:hypothetical protein